MYTYALFLIRSFTINQIFHIDKAQVIQPGFQPFLSFSILLI